MLKKENLKSYIDELIKEVEEELKESTTTGGVDGYQTPFAFSGKRKQDKAKADSNIEVTGYTKVKDIDESTTPSDIIKDLDKVRHDLIKKVDVLIAKKKKLYSNVDIESPMSADEKQLDKDIQSIFSQIQSIIQQKRKIKESVNEGSLYSSQNLIKKLTPKIEKDVELLKKQFPNYDITLVKNRYETDGSYTLSISGKNTSTIDNNKLQNTIKSKIKESVNESWEVKDGKVLSNGKLIGYYEFDRDSDSFWVDDVKKGKGQLSFDTKREVEDYFKKNEKDALKSLGKLRGKYESVSEGKVKRPVNRWLELKNDESMHANKKLAVGLKELKHQLSEVEKFFRWYNQIKTMNELSSDVFWKRTHGHIYKIKERLINIAKTIQEIEK
jgi:hypothetical protein